MKNISDETKAKIVALMTQHCPKGYEEDPYDTLGNICDSTCTTGYDNDDNTGLEIFENGVNLAGRTLAEQTIWIIQHPDDNVAWFFISKDEDELLRYIERQLKDW